MMDIVFSEDYVFELQTENRRLEAKLKTSQDEREGYRQHFEAARIRIDQLNAIVTELEASVERAKAVVTRYGEDLVVERARVVKLEAENVDLKRYMSEHKGELRTLRVRILDMKAAQKSRPMSQRGEGKSDG